jgi:chloramphenicol O-acetyltransferase type A
MKKLDIHNWNRREHFEFFSKMANPFFGIVTEIECTRGYETAKALETSFFGYYLHKSMVAVNSVDEFKIRIVDHDILEFEVIHAGTTIGREDGTFGFAFIPFSPSYQQFNLDLQNEIKEVQNSTGLRLNNDNIKKDLIRHSTFPWNSFSALLHPTNLDNKESVPKITFGKFSERENKKYLPISVEAHHGLVDGLHIAQYLKRFEQELNHE